MSNKIPFRETVFRKAEESSWIKLGITVFFEIIGIFIGILLGVSYTMGKNDEWASHVDKRMVILEGNSKDQGTILLAHTNQLNRLGVEFEDLENQHEKDILALSREVKEQLSLIIDLIRSNR